MRTTSRSRSGARRPARSTSTPRSRGCSRTGSARGATARPAAEPLTEREREVLALVAKGHSNKEIASLLDITERTARTHVSNILGKLDLASRTQAALWAIEHHVV